MVPGSVSLAVTVADRTVSGLTLRRIQTSGEMSLYQWSRLMLVVIVCLCIERCHCIITDRRDEGLAEVPTDIPTNATDLWLGFNSITALRDCEFCQYTQLRDLRLRYNLINVISSSAFQNTILDIIYLFGNQLVVVPSLQFIEETIRYLELGGNQITSIEQTTFDECKSLERLELDENQLTTLGNISVETLEIIDLENNPLVCDSRLLWLKDAAERGVTVRDFTCPCPSSLQGRYFSDVTREELAPVGKSQHVRDASCIHMMLMR